MTRRPGSLLFRLLLLLYPPAFREAHGAEMAELFTVRMERAEGPLARARCRVRMVADMVENGWVLRRRARRGGAWKQEEGARMAAWMHDLRQALRHLARAPLFALSAVVLLAVGLGANITVFTLVDALLFRPPPWDDPDRVVMVYQDSDDGDPSASAFPAYRDIAADADVFESVSAMAPAFVRITWERPDGGLDLAVEYATSTYLDVVGLTPLRGRWFSPEHDRVGSEPVAVVSASAWRRLMGADPGVVGQSITLNGISVRVVGVGPAEISGSYPPRTTDFWLSISATPVSGAFRVANLDRREDHWYDIRARLAPGTSVEQAQAAMDALALGMGEAFPELDRGRGITVFRSRDVRVHPEADRNLYLMGSVLGAVVVVLLLLTCANLANLLLARGLGRSGEMAVRRALGAGRARVARLFLLESLLLAVMGGAAGAALAHWVVALLPTLPVPAPGWERLELALDARVGAFSAALVLVTGVLFGLAPALRSARSDVAGSLRDGERAGSARGGVRRLRDALVAVQVAASLVLVLGAGMLVRSVGALQGVDPGLDAGRVAWVRADLTRSGLAGAELRVAVREMVERLSAVPGVSRAGATSRLPAEGGGTTTTVVEEYTPPGGTDAVELAFAVVTDGYFDVLGVPLVTGRGFEPADVGSAPVILVNETAARRFWGGADEALGRRTRSQGGETWRTVVGVVGDVPVGSVAEPVRPMMFFYAESSATAAPRLVVRTDGDPAAILPALRAEVAAGQAGVNVVGLGTMSGWLDDGLAGPRMAATLMGGFSALALLLAGMGIYAVVSFSVARRTAELGIRMALGAGRNRVVRTVLREVMGTVAVGVAVGVALGWLAGRPLEGVLFGVDPLDPLGFVGAVTFLTCVAGLAAWIPARRAARTDPVQALRAG